MKIDDLKEIINILLLRVKENIGDEISFSNDYYWDIANNQLYDPYNMPTDITLGSLYDDISEVDRLLLSSDDAIVYDLKRIAEILKALSAENSTAF